MSESSTVTAEGAALRTDTLSYPDIPQPAPGEIAQAAPGVHWLRMPLPGELGHINLWLIEHEGGFVLVDTGMASDECRAAWQTIETTLLEQRPLRLIAVTHLHPDHVGLAAWLQERHRVPVWMSRTSELQVRHLLTPQSPAELSARERHFTSHGMSGGRELASFTGGAHYRQVVSGIPEVSHHPSDGEETRWGEASWRWLAVGGHAAGHLCLHAPRLKVLISGDQVLPTISPNVGLHDARLDTNPLASYLASLERLAQLDADTLVLPSHGRPFMGLRPRTADLRSHHRAQLDRLLAACSRPLSAQDALSVMFARPLRGFHRFLGIGEAIAHLEYLVAEGRLERRIDDKGVVRFAAPMLAG